MNINELFKELPTTSISDVLGGLTNLNYNIKPMQEQDRIAGRAFTVTIPVGDNLTVLQAIREASPGDVLVIDAKGDTTRAVAGDFIVGLARAVGLQGIVVDGVIRDVEGIRTLNFPIFTRGTTIAASSKYGGGKTNVPISAGGVSVHPGDVIIGDVDGVVVVPQGREQQVAEEARGKIAQDQQRELDVSGNKEAALRYLDKVLGISKS
ncbi:RraA famliy [Paenibacillus algorifonticola]|uniref:Putative 4-hydroxy-4-methyl-2-oxoglutarate aldolase n=1 Tax=Paenibacillus algorifonticola TaxID=684063 RepID=A0A1I2BY06_9BACL|nr:RraA famliy [Paenibacillus algorifonticola]